MVEHVLKQLTKGVERDIVYVRVMRKWSYYGTYGSPTPLFIGLVVGDKEV